MGLFYVFVSWERVRKTSSTMHEYSSIHNIIIFYILQGASPIHCVSDTLPSNTTDWLNIVVWIMYPDTDQIRTSLTVAIKYAMLIHTFILGWLFQLCNIVTHYLLFSRHNHGHGLVNWALAKKTDSLSLFPFLGNSSTKYWPTPYYAVVFILGEV